ncbi:NAD(P)-binding protein [Aspergillus karnatakaensis]|uniref:NAD(P)-binding protein n=1 Tax=Aspergillus karnatakaensis TaxID=1810916 RepID=UPI003CCD7F7C
MPSYVVTGASRGLGYEFIRQIAADPSNIAIGLVRNKAAADEKAKAQGLTNAHFVEAQYTDLASLKKAAEEVKALTGGTLNYLINNAASVSAVTELRTLGDFHDDFEKLEADILDQLTVNLLGVIKTIEAFTPLLKSTPSTPSSPKKVITITSGMSDTSLINAVELSYAAPYAISKGAVNVAIAKYNALYKSEGILFMGICPGYVATERQTQEITDKTDLENLQKLGAQFARFAEANGGGGSGQISPEESVRGVLGLAHRATVEEFGGAFVSRFGNKEWF